MSDDDQIDINEAFDNIALIEEKLSKKGYEEGFQEGIKQGNLEGYQLGYAKGIELGEELGTYYALAIENLDSANSEKLKKSIKLLMKLIDEFPKTNDPERDIIQEIQSIRTQYKKVKSLLKLPSPEKKKEIKDFTF